MYIYQKYAYYQDFFFFSNHKVTVHFCEILHIPLKYHQISDTDSGESLVILHIQLSFI